MTISRIAFLEVDILEDPVELRVVTVTGWYHRLEVNLINCGQHL
jgi:hypothetical protein